MELTLRIIELTSGKVVPANNWHPNTAGGFQSLCLNKLLLDRFFIYIPHFPLPTLRSHFICSALDRVSSASVTMSHLIAYDPERDLLPLILAHCNYSLEVGQETLVHYDWAALERQLIDRFLRGRPFVEFKVSC